MNLSVFLACLTIKELIHHYGLENIQMNLVLAVNYLLWLRRWKVCWNREFKKVALASVNTSSSWWVRLRGTTEEMLPRIVVSKESLQPALHDSRPLNDHSAHTVSGWVKQTTAWLKLGIIFHGCCFRVNYYVTKFALKRMGMGEKMGILCARNVVGTYSLFLTKWA